MKAKGRQERKESNDYFILNFPRQWSWAISYINVSNLLCLSFHPSLPVELPQFVLDPLLALTNPPGVFCQIRIDESHC